MDGRKFAAGPTLEEDENVISTIRRKLLHRGIRRLMADEAAANSVTYNRNLPYQAYERIRLGGARPVEQRIAEYRAMDFVTPQSAVLDIGSNSGFFVVELARHVRLAHGVEPNPHLNGVGALVARHLGVAGRTAFFDCTFDAFATDQKYDLIMSLAAFHTSDGRERSDAGDYFGKVQSLLKEGGTLIYESTAHKKEDDPTEPFYTTSRVAMHAAVKEIERRFVVLRDKEATVYNVPNGYRRLIVAAHTKSHASNQV